MRVPSSSYTTDRGPGQALGETQLSIDHPNGGEIFSIPKVLPPAGTERIGAALGFARTVLHLKWKFINP